MAEEEDSVESDVKEGETGEPEESVEDALEETEDEEKQSEDSEEESELESRRIGSLSIDLDRERSNDEVMIYSVEAEVEGEETRFELPRYDTHLGWIEVFGLPPFNEWVLLREFQYLNKSFSGQLNGENYSESIEVEKKGVTGHRINLQRTMEDEEEYYNIRTFETPQGNTDSIFECINSRGVYTAAITKKEINNPDEGDLKILGEEQRKYAQKIFEKEGQPDKLTLKKSRIDGPTPAIYRKLFPFWDKEEFDDSQVISVELGYLNQGDNKTELDKAHGDWFKLFQFQEFDHSMLEIREGNWRSTTDWFKGDRKNTKEHYEKHLYTYSEENEPGNQD
ncbi:MAG: hypothetical protein ABEK10_01670 [Candidatus Nanosalina sp.]